MKVPRRFAVVAPLLVALLTPGAATGEREALALVRRAFERTLQVPGIRSVELRVHRAGRLVARRALDVATRRDGKGAAWLVRFSAPGVLRGHALLVVETAEGGTDTWLYRADRRRPRLVGTAHRADSFYGTDLSFGDLGRWRLEDFALRRLPDANEAGLDRAVIEATPRRPSRCDRLVVWIDVARTAVVRVDFHRGTEVEPTRRLRVDLADAQEDAGYLRVPRMRVEQVGRDAWTEVVTRRQVVDPALPAEVFSSAVLEREGVDLYDWVQRRVPREDAP